MPRYEWRTEKNGNQRFVRISDEPIVTKVKHIAPPSADEMVIEPPTPPVAEPVETTAKAAPKPAKSKATVKVPAKRKAKSGG